MCKDLQSAKELAFIDEKEEALLGGVLAPIVILKAKKPFL